MDIECEAGDLFYESVVEGDNRGLQRRGNHFKMWGLWIYADGELVGLLSKPFGKDRNWTEGSYLVRPGFEQIVQSIRNRE